MKKVWITPGCISCGSCAFIAPEVFEVTVSSAVKEEADISKYQELIEKAAQACPVQVIKYQKE
jgi:ferredoxin